MTATLIALLTPKEAHSDHRQLRGLKGLSVGLLDRAPFIKSSEKGINGGFIILFTHIMRKQHTILRFRHEHQFDSFSSKSYRNYHVNFLAE